jgi:hypothetical protein
MACPVCLSVLCAAVLLLRRLRSRSAARGGPEIVIERAHWVDASSEARTLSASKRDPATCDLDGGGVRSTEEQSQARRNCPCSKKQNIGSRSKPKIFLRCWSWAAVSSFESGITTATVLRIILQRLIFMAWHGIAWHVEMPSRPNPPWRRDTTAGAELAHRTGPPEAPARLAVRSREPEREREREREDGDLKRHSQLVVSLNLRRTSSIAAARHMSASDRVLI